MLIANLVHVIWEWFYSVALLKECLKKKELLGRTLLIFMTITQFFLNFRCKFATLEIC
jgi:hypothetical protein